MRKAHGQKIADRDGYPCLLFGASVKTSEILPYFQNTFWLLLPILAVNIGLAKRLPRAYQRDVFWKNIPSWIAVPENLFRLPVFLLPLSMRFGATSPSQQLGVRLYIIGSLLYTRIRKFGFPIIN